MDPELLKALNAQAEALKASIAAQLDDKMKIVTEKAEAAAKAAVDAKIAAQAKTEPPAVVVAATAKNAPAAPVRTPGVTVGKHASEGTGINFARFVKAKAVSAMEHRPILDVLKGWGDEVVSKALSENSFANGGSLVHPQFAAEFIELLRAQTVVRKAGARQIPMGATLTFDRQTGASSAAYAGETTNIVDSAPTTDALSLSEKKLVALTGVPNDLLRNSSINVEEMVRDDLMKVVALAEDKAFLIGSGGQFSPKGLFLQIASANRYNETINTAGAPTLQEMKKELDKAKRTLKKANVPLSRPVWLISPNVEFAITSAVGPGAEGFNVLETEYTKNGTLRGYPVFVSNQIPTTAGGSSDRSYIYLVDMSEVIIADSMALEIEVFPNGAFSQNGSLVSGISTDQTAIRAIAKHDIGMRHSVSGIVVQNSSWGNS